MNTEMLIFHGEKETKRGKHHHTHQKTLFLTKLNPELWPPTASSASFLLIFSDSVSTSVVHLLWSGAAFRNRKTRFAENETVCFPHLGSSFLDVV